MHGLTTLISMLHACKTVIKIKVLFQNYLVSPVPHTSDIEKAVHGTGETT